MFNTVFCREEYAAYVDCPHAVKVVHVHTRHIGAAMRNAGIATHDINLTEVIDRCLHHGDVVLFICHIDPDGDRAG